MITIVRISLENEMDLVLAHKKSIAVAGKLGLTIATQTTFGTAVSEISRTVIEHTDTGVLEIGLEINGGRYSLKATISCDDCVGFNSYDTGFSGLYCKLPFSSFDTSSSCCTRASSLEV